MNESLHAMCFFDLLHCNSVRLQVKDSPQRTPVSKGKKLAVVGASMGAGVLEMPEPISGPSLPMTAALWVMWVLMLCKHVMLWWEARLVCIAVQHASVLPRFRTKLLFPQKKTLCKQYFIDKICTTTNLLLCPKMKIRSTSSYTKLTFCCSITFTLLSLPQPQ